MSRKKKTLPDWDDGRVIAPMNVPGMPWHRESRFPAHGKESAPQALDENEQPNREAPFRLTGGERKAILKALFSVLIPVVLGFAAILGLAMWLIQRFWLGV